LWSYSQEYGLAHWCEVEDREGKKQGLIKSNKRKFIYLRKTQKKNMATYTININESTKEGKSILALFKSLSSISFIKKTEKTPSIDISLKEARQGKTHKAKDGFDLIENCLK